MHSLASLASFLQQSVCMLLAESLSRRRGKAFAFVRQLGSDVALVVPDTRCDQLGQASSEHQL